MNTAQHIPPGFRIGHWTDINAITGCTVILCPDGTVGGCDVRGSSPGSRELTLLESEKTMQQVHAILLTGGSAFGLAAADGVMKFLEQNNTGYQTPWGKVPIVPAAVIFDLNIGAWNVRPTAESGMRACESATERDIPQGSVGAGTGSTVGKWAGTDSRMKGGIGIASHRIGELVVSTVAVVNAVGDVLDESMDILAGARSPDGAWLGKKDPLRRFARNQPILQANTTLVAVMSNARFTKVQVNRMAQRAQNGLARTIKPVHTSYDGDVVFGLASGVVDADFDFVAEVAADTTAGAIRNAVRNAISLGGVPACKKT